MGLIDQTLTVRQVQWRPWGDEARLPTFVQSSCIASTRRIFFIGPKGGEWYLAERVIVQSLGKRYFLVPKHPPHSMFVRERLTVIIEKWALDGKPATCFVDRSGIKTYDDCLNKWIRSKKMRVNITYLVSNLISLFCFSSLLLK